MIFLYILGGIVAVFLLLIIIAPKSFEISRSITINKPVHEVYDYLKFIKNQDNWAPWNKKDPNMKREFEGTDGTVGFLSKWEGNKDVGMGEQEITGLTSNERVDSQLRFLKPWKSVSDAYLLTNDAGGNQTEVVWGFSGKNKIPFNVFMMFFNMDKTVGKDFEEGLASLKEILER